MLIEALNVKPDYTSVGVVGSRGSAIYTVRFGNDGSVASVVGTRCNLRASGSLTVTPSAALRSEIERVALAAKAA